MFTTTAETTTTIHPIATQPRPAGTPPDGNPADWSAAIETLLNQPTSSLPLRLAMLGIAFTGATAIWAWQGQMDEVATANGKLVPKGRTASVQPLEMGTVARIAVKEGQVVKKGQVILEMDTTLADREVERLQILLQSTQTEYQQSAMLIRQTQLQGETRFSIAQSQIDGQRIAIGQLRQEARTQQTVMAQLQDDAIAQNTRLARFKPLADIGAISKEQVFTVEQSVRERQRSMTQSRGELANSQGQVQRLTVELQQKQAEARQVQQATNRELQELKLRLGAMAAKSKETQVLIATAQAKRNQRFIHAPIAGTILALNIQQQGRVIQPGEQLAEIAPAGQPLILSTVLSNQQAGFIKLGMPVKVKLDAYPYQDHGTIAGKIVAISPDSTSSEKLGEVYRVDIALDRHYVTAKGQKRQLKPGLTATAEIVTRKRRVMDVILEPFQKLRSDAASS
jgi:hemolysin D